MLRANSRHSLQKITKIMQTFLLAIVLYPLRLFCMLFFSLLNSKLGLHEKIHIVICFRVSSNTECGKRYRKRQHSVVCTTPHRTHTHSDDFNCNTKNLNGIPHFSGYHMPLLAVIFSLTGTPYFYARFLELSKLVTTSLSLSLVNTFP